MKQTIDELNELRAELTQITKDVQMGKLTYAEAAEKILLTREHMDRLIEELKQKSHDKDKLK